MQLRSREPDMGPANEAMEEGSELMSPEEITAFRRLLGIPDEERFNAYLALGLAPFETEPEKISDAAADTIKMIQNLPPSSATNWIGHRQIRAVERIRKCLLDMKAQRKHDDDIRLHLENESPEEYFLRIPRDRKTNWKIPEFRSLEELMSKKPESQTMKILLTTIGGSIAAAILAVLTTSQDRGTNQASIVPGFNNKPPVAAGGAGGDFKVVKEKEQIAPVKAENSAPRIKAPVTSPSQESEFARRAREYSARYQGNRVITPDPPVEHTPTEASPVTVSTGKPVDAGALFFTEDSPDYLTTIDTSTNARSIEETLEMEAMLAFHENNEVPVLEYSPTLKALEEQKINFSHKIPPLMKLIIADGQRAIDEKKFNTAYTLIFRLSRLFHNKPMFEMQKEEIRDQINVLIANYQATEKPRWAKDVEEAKLLDE